MCEKHYTEAATAKRIEKLAGLKTNLITKIPELMEIVRWHHGDMPHKPINEETKQAAYCYLLEIFQEMEYDYNNLLDEFRGYMANCVKKRKLIS